jgi:hypothetical protein
VAKPSAGLDKIGSVNFPGRVVVFLFLPKNLSRNWHHGSAQHNFVRLVSEEFQPSFQIGFAGGNSPQVLTFADPAGRVQSLAYGHDSSPDDHGV